VLPLVMVDDRVVAEGAYPSRETLAALAGVVVRKLNVAPSASASSCSPGSNAKGSSGCC
jgi:Arsenical resistance operon protein ArsD